MQRNNVKLGIIDNDVNVTSLELIDNDFNMIFKVDNLYNFKPILELKPFTLGDLKSLTSFEIYYK